MNIKTKLSAALCVLCCSSMMISAAHADVFGLWVKPKFDFVSGTGEVFKRFGGQPAGGLEVGVELLGISFWGDAEFMSESQYWASGNVGIDFSFGEEVELTLGAYAGLIFFGFPDTGDNDEGQISNAQQMRISEILEPLGASYSDFESKYNEVFGEEEKLANTAFGLNGRLRLSVEYHILSALSIGVQGSSGYHYVISGEEAAGGTKSVAIDGFVNTQLIPDEQVKAELKNELKTALGAEEVDLDDLKGVNYSVGAFINVSF